MATIHPSRLPGVKAEKEKDLSPGLLAGAHPCNSRGFFVYSVVHDGMAMIDYLQPGLGSRGGGGGGRGSVSILVSINIFAWIFGAGF